MSAIDKIMIDIAEISQAWRLDDVEAADYDADAGELRDAITAAIAEARREGAEAMRDDCARLALRNPLHYGSGESAEEELAQAIEDLPLPTGPRQAVLLTDEQIIAAVRPLYACTSAAAMGAADDIKTARAIEAAVLAINGLEVRR